MQEIACNMSAIGCGWDNAVVESFFSTLKLVLDLDDDCPEPINPQQLQRDLVIWIASYYNHEHRYSTIGRRSVIDDAQQFIAARTHTTVIP